MLRALQEDYDVHYYDIDIEADAGSETVAGSVVVRATSTIDGLDTVVLDLYDNMTVDSVEHDGAPASYTHSSDAITVTLNSSINAGDDLKLEITYHGALGGGLRHGIAEAASCPLIWNGRARPFHTVWRSSGYGRRAGSLRRFSALHVPGSCSG